jgi:site-specific DNA-adenine methylase
MWSYYGSKTNLAAFYPKPAFDTIIEPFAGAAKYSLLHFEKEIILVDKYPLIIDIWNWLKVCSEKDILGLPRNLELGAKLDDMKFDCAAQKHFYGFVIGCGSQRPLKTATKRKTIDRPNHINFNLKKIAANLYKIRHWNFICDDYINIANQKATWFIDPPYQFGGGAYPMSNKKIDFTHLGDWCREREGQVIVCENTKADWMDFIPIIKQRGSLYSTTEAIWTNYHTHFNNVQQSLEL